MTLLVDTTNAATTGYRTVAPPAEPDLSFRDGPQGRLLVVICPQCGARFERPAAPSDTAPSPETLTLFRDHVCQMQSLPAAVVDIVGKLREAYLELLEDQALSELPPACWYWPTAGGDALVAVPLVMPSTVPEAPAEEQLAYQFAYQQSLGVMASQVDTRLSQPMLLHVQAQRDQGVVITAVYPSAGAKMSEDEHVLLLRSTRFLAELGPDGQRALSTELDTLLSPIDGFFQTWAAHTPVPLLRSVLTGESTP